MNIFKNFFPAASRRTPFAAVGDLIPVSARSKQMDEAINLWQQIFLRNPYWVSSKHSRSLNLASVASQYVARLVCTELEVDIYGSKKADLVDSAFKSFLTQLPMAVQSALALGEVAFRPFVQDGKVLIEWLRADQFYPVEINANGDISKIVFLSYANFNNSLFLRAEIHHDDGLLYHITNQAFLCSADGKPKSSVSLDKVPQWKNLREEVVISNLNSKLFAVWRMPFANTIDATSQPVSIYANALGVLRDIDRLYDDYCFEFDTARRKLILREDSLRLRNDGSPILPHSEHADDVFLPLDLSGDSSPFGDYTPQIREQDYRNALNQLFRLFEMQIGISSGTFSLDNNGAATATEIISKDRKTFYTVREIQEQGKLMFSELICAVSNLVSLYALAPEGDVDFSVSFGDSVFEDTESEFQRRLKLVELGMKPELLLQWYFNKSCSDAKDMLRTDDIS